MSKNKKIHLNKLVDITEDNYSLCAAVETRFLDLCGAYLRIRGEELKIPPSLQGDMVLWRTLAVRLKSGDLRNTEGEIQALRNVAQWTLDVNCEIRNQASVTIDWEEGE